MILLKQQTDKNLIFSHILYIHGKHIFIQKSEKLTA